MCKIYEILPSSPFLKIWQEVQPPPSRKGGDAHYAFSYNLASCLYDLLLPVILIEQSLKDTFSFLAHINSANLTGKFLVSCDATSYFTNSPVQETINIAINLILNNNPNINIIKKELSFCYITNPFSLNGKFYNQLIVQTQVLLCLLSLLMMAKRIQH